MNMTATLCVPSTHHHHDHHRKPLGIRLGTPLRLYHPKILVSWSFAVTPFIAVCRSCVAALPPWLHPPTLSFEPWQTLPLGAIENPCLSTLVLQRGQTSTSRALGSRVQSCRTPLVAHGTCAEHGKSLSTFSMHSCRLWPASIFMSSTVTQHSAVGATRSVSRLRGTPGCPSIAGKRRQYFPRARLRISLPGFHASSFGRHVTALLRVALETHVRIGAGGT
jgi:hypothetical protein